MDYCYGKNPLNFWFDSTRNGRTAAILDFRYDILYVDDMQHGSAT